MRIITKLIKYGLVFALGYYVGSCNINTQPKSFSKLEQEAVKYEQNDLNGYEPRLFSQKLRRNY